MEAWGCLGVGQVRSVSGRGTFSDGMHPGRSAERSEEPGRSLGFVLQGHGQVLTGALP